MEHPGSDSPGPARLVLGNSRLRIAPGQVSPQRRVENTPITVVGSNDALVGQQRFFSSERNVPALVEIQTSSSTPNIHENTGENNDANPISLSTSAISNKPSSNRSPRGAAFIGARGSGAPNVPLREASSITALGGSIDRLQIGAHNHPPVSPRTSNSQLVQQLPPPPPVSPRNSNPIAANTALRNSSSVLPPPPMSPVSPRNSSNMQAAPTPPQPSTSTPTAVPPLSRTPSINTTPSDPPPSPKKKTAEERGSVVFDSKEPGIGYSDEGGRRIIKLGLLEKLLEKLFDPNPDNAKYIEEFLITFPTFTDSATVLKMLIERYNRAGPADLALRVHCVSTVLWTYVEHNFDMAREKDTIQFLGDIVKKEPSTSPLTNAANQIRVALARLRRNEDPFPIEIVNREEKIPKPIVPKNAGSIEDISPKEIARQITLLSHEFYRRIKVSELLNQAWSKKEKEKRAPNLLAFIDRFNKTSLWVASLVIMPEDVIRRAAVISHFVKVAKEMLAINNFDGMMAILTGLQNSSVVRLKQTWRLVTSSAKADYEELKALMKFESNYKVYREQVMQLNPPAVPFIAPFLSDLTFVDENPKEIQGMINFGKCRLIARIISKVRQFQREPYLFEAVEMIEKYLKSITLPNEADLYKLSTKREEKGDETQAATALVNNLFS